MVLFRNKSWQHLLVGLWYMAADPGHGEKVQEAGVWILELRLPRAREDALGVGIARGCPLVRRGSGRLEQGVAVL